MPAVDGLGAAADRVQVPPPGGGRARVPDRCGRHDDHPRPGSVHPPPEVEVVAEDRERGVEAAERVPDVPPHERPRGADGQHVADRVVLALVELTALQPGRPVPGPVGGQADLDEHPRLVPVEGLGPEQADAGAGGAVLEQSGERRGLGGDVVVQEPEPGGRAPGGVGLGGQRLGDRRAEAGPPRQRQHPVDGAAGGAAQQRRRAVGAAGVDGQHAARGDAGGRQGGQRLGQPELTVVRDEDRRDVDDRAGRRLLPAAAPLLRAGGRPAGGCGRAEGHQRQDRGRRHVRPAGRRSDAEDGGRADPARSASLDEVARTARRRGPDR